MKTQITDHLWWMILTVFWVAFASFCLLVREYLTAILGIGALVGLLLSARVGVTQRQRIRYLKITIASLEQALKEAHRHDPR